MKRIKLALYDPLDDSRPLRTLEVFDDTYLDRLEALDCILEFNKLAENDPDILLNMGIFPARKAAQRKAVS